jgi:phospholipid/cholesterol/gamma-HCH transport system substrate-binding protein
MNRNRAVDFWVGLFVLAGIAALIFLALRATNAAGSSVGPTYSVNARFTNIGGLKVRAPVRSAGVTVGRVNGISFDPQTFEAVVSFTIGTKYPFPKDTSAQILTAGLLGEQYVGLSAGGDTTDLNNGDTIQITQSAVILENLIGQFLYSKAAEGGQNGGGQAPSGGGGASSPGGGGGSSGAGGANAIPSPRGLVPGAGQGKNTAGNKK